MIKLVEFVIRNPDLTHEEFAEYWLETHSPLASELPGLQRYVTSLPVDPDESEYDGVLELYFTDREALSSAFGSETGQEVLADAEQFIQVGEGPSMVVEETVQVDRN